MRVLINGCSHTAIESYGVNGQETSFKDKDISHIGNPNIRKSWIWELKKLINIKNVYTVPQPKINLEISKYSKIFNKETIISLANDAQGNDSIMFSTLSFLRELDRINKKPDLVLIQFSGPVRRIVSRVDDNITFSTPHENYEFGMNFEPSGSFLTLNNMIVLQDYLKTHKYNYYFLNYFPINNIVENLEIYKELDLSKFITYKNNHPIFDGWLNDVVKDGLSIDEFGHPNEECMEIISNKFYEKLILDKKII
jgi:hypothetical protein